ncbi:DUF2069 domain-containing protein [sulfur-oxidizing endosymbiont of Gigantopelta aegis]|uniref:DUF2069 domain-containing protein n=1 Tax=sulfur-oxidizing endosymbiont of Gigantopelta aegis TaxID=2794934 RepID=UPI0018DEC435|nr:DUF2069 domain-containing protein [sulfur-oxidizing endosymbiont of Gigantopelta aegis]
MFENQPETQKKLRLTQNIALIGYFSLFFILMINIIWLIPSRHFPTGLVLLVIVTPLLFPMMGLLKSNTYTYQWASFLTLPYFAHGISEVAAYPEIWWAGVLETLAAIVMYLGCVMYASIFKKEFKKRQLEENE